jgi:glycosyltransferase involved in cell wall biosynthesis
MRVLHVISGIDPVFGGPVAALVGLAEAQARAGLDVTIASSWGHGQDISHAERLRGAGVRVELIGPAIRRLGTWHPRTGAVLRGLVPRADVVHIHALWEDIQHRAAAVARVQRVPYLFRPCGMLDPWSLSRSRWRKRAYMAWRLRRDLNGAAAIHFTTDPERDLTGPLGLSAPAIVEPNGVDLSEFETAPARGTFRRRHPQLGQGPTLVFLGRIHLKKGLDLLIAAMARLRTPGVTLVIVGPDEGGYQGEVERMVAAGGLTGRVVFTGMLRGREKLEALADADLFVLPSYTENFGVAVVEALAAGTPVVVSDRVNLHPEITAAGVGGVVPLGAAALAAELDRWLGDDALRAAAAARARPFVRERYDWRQIAARWVEHYRRLSAGAVPAVRPAAGVPSGTVDAA